MCSPEISIDLSRFDCRIKETGRELRVFFENVLKSLCTTSNFKPSEYRKSLGDIRSHRSPDVEIHAEVDFKKDCYRHAYIFAYSIIHSLTIYDRFLHMMILNPRMMKRITLMKKIRLCILGGGPAFEAVAISKLLSNVLAQLGPEGRDPVQLRVTVIDICTEWENEVTFIISSLQHELSTCKNVTVKYSFIEADLTKKFSPDVSKAFRKAHFVTMNKFVSDVQKASGMKKVFRMIDNFSGKMTEHSCLFLLDFSGGSAFNKADNKINSFPSFERIYGPALHHCFKLKEVAVERFSVNMENIFPGLKCTRQSTSSCSAWMKDREFKNSKLMCSPEEINFYPLCFNPNRKETTRELRVFYENILKSLCTTKDFKRRAYQESLDDNRSLRHPDVEIHSVFDYEKDCYRHAYIFDYSIIHSLTIYDRFSDMMINNPAMMVILPTMKDIGLCVFGGGPAFEVVAITKLLSNVVAQLGPEGRDPLLLRVTVIDICTEWEHEMRCIINSIQHELTTCKNVTVNFTFIEADLAREFPPDVMKAFTKAHFITMNKFTSDVQKVCGREKLFDMIENLIGKMSEHSCLFLLDFSGGSTFNKTYKQINTIPSIVRIYGPTLHHCYQIKEVEAERFSANMENIFPGLKCTRQSTCSCSAWMKELLYKNSKLMRNYISDQENTSVLKKREKDKCKEKQLKIKVKNK